MLIDQVNSQGNNLYSYVSMKPDYYKHCNQSEVYISTNVFELYLLQVKVNRRNYNHVMHYNTVKKGAMQMYVIIYITWLSQPCYVFI